MKPIEMLTEVLRRAQLSARERESFEDMLDRISRFRRCSDKQKAWIEKVYFGQQLERPPAAVARRRVVIPNWQTRKEDTGIHQCLPQPPQPSREKAPALIKAVGTEAKGSKQVLVKNRPRTGTFMATPTAAKAPPIGRINYPGVQRETLVTNLLTFEEICPRIEPGSRQHQKVAEFFARGGVVLKVKPLAAAQAG